MAYNTETIQNFIESFSAELVYDSVKNIRHAERIEIGRPELFDFDYPLFDESYRREFETKIIRQFYMTEIGHETFGLFKFQLETWLNLHMPYYNQLYLSTLLDYDPLINTDYKVTSLSKKDNQQTDKGNRTQDNTSDSTKGKKFTDETIGKTGTEGSSHTKGNSNTDTKNDTDSDGSKNDNISDVGETLNSDKGNKDVKSFNRKVGSDTPDSRLQITTNDDGTGVIEYASNIDETKDINREDHDRSYKENSKNERIGSSNTKNKVNETGNSKTDATTDVDYKEDVNSKFNTNQLTDETGNVKGNIKENSDKEMKANEVKDYIEHRIGKQGVESYPEMVMKFRKAMINVDQQILKAMRKELFMLIY